MQVKGITPVLNVSDLAASFTWFEKWGWKKKWDWGTPPLFGAAGCDDTQIFLCLNCQGGRGKGTNTTTFQVDGDEAGDKGVWMCVFVDDVEQLHGNASPPGWRSPPTNVPWGMREMHLRHPDGHVFRVGRGLEQD